MDGTAAKLHDPAASQALPIAISPSDRHLPRSWYDIDGKVDELAEMFSAHGAMPIPLKRVSDANNSR